MEFSLFFERLRGLGDQALVQVNAFDAPVPDYVLIGGALIMILAFARAQRRSVAGVRTLFEEAYGPVLISAHRRAYQARAALRKAELELEHERQRRRREKRRADGHSDAAGASVAELRPNGPVKKKTQIGDPRKVVKLTREYNNFILSPGANQ